MSIWSRRTSKGDMGTWDVLWQTTSITIPWAGASPQLMGLGTVPLRGWQDEALPSGALQSPSAEDHAPAQPLDPAHSLPLPCSLLTLLWHHTLSVLSAARGPQVPSVQHCQRLFCALKVPKGEARGPWKDRGLAGG